MASTNKSTPVPYSPANPPYTDQAQELSRCTWDELYRIAERFVSIETPASISVVGSDVVTIQPTEVWNRLFDTAPSFDWEQPKGQLDQLTGIWTCPQEGLYNAQIIIEIPAFPNPGSRIYNAKLRTTRTPADGSGIKTYYSFTGGPDEAALRLIALFLNPLNKGDALQFDLDLTEDTYTGSITALSILNIFRVSTIK